ncbi:ErmE/ErmH/ErmO/ErmR family 23S rRNA (adenine(2058)-N(6))-methyltransferase [Streptomyces armeniacus]|uniref:ErmE/ErmH/ErmO/ErmR family 23S rRNA (Adenine(2058)-N(6))-methyltransferase n=1 Tax=Streptomyces armeniacus TaxID=83291 RepID=A0A345XNQ5_9ACTN|nr:ErmE/ErmH/ErmO/ErmR family 23S rRNA (adenine(2058)-N(6))-methyltransferase [Streptomyces armeniacus]AXK33271.1 ErmE/ErmH/ErmO/ErmR family 23S rRNA (adenine(2058)-N(6))-methyltransferase [Streptomyces armeniacus]
MARRRKTLSQNFLHHPAAVQRIVRSAALPPDALVVEPGAGEGVLTRALAGRVRRVIAYEIDPRLAARLPARVRSHPNVRPVHGDFLRARAPREPFAVVGNIPYARTADIVRWCLDAPRLTSATLLTQLEYARKRTGGYGRWSLLTVRTWPEYEWRLLTRIGRECFTPVPRTDSALLRLERRPEPLLPPERLAAYREFVGHGFTGVGGSLAATLARRYRTRGVRAAFGRLGLDEAAPVGVVPPEQWLRLFRELAG